MPFFSRILDFKRDLLARLRNQRSHPRHPVGTDFPLKASLCLAGTEKFDPNHAPVRGSGLSWSGRVGNISASGLSILLSPAAATARGEPTLLRLSLEDQELVFPCTIAHFRAMSSHALCGVRLEMGEFQAQKAYQQIVEAVKLGSSFAAVGPGRSQAGFVRKTWRSTGRTLLTEWREHASRALVRFELNLGDHTVHGQSFPPGIEVRQRDGQADPVAPELQEEVRRLFRWLTGNLPKNVPVDLRALMARVGRYAPTPPDQGAWRAPVTARAFTSTVIKVPRSAWQAPRGPAPVPTA